MAVQAGGGAATFAGASYQAAVAAYFILSIICDFDTELLGAARPRSISFETANPVDDINITLEADRTAYLQVKRQLSFSLAPGQELYECFDQFVRQWAEDKNIHSLAIVTTSESSRRVTVGLSAVTEAIRSGAEAEFRRDQNKSMVRDLDLVLDAIKFIYMTYTSRALEHDQAIAILQRIHVCTLDLSKGSAIEQAAFMLLNARGCVSPALLWGNLIADCGAFASSRRSVTFAFLTDRYSKYFSASTASADQAKTVTGLFDVISSGEIPTGREVTIGTIVDDSLGTNKTDICIMEFYRFDDHCAQRLKFRDGKCILQSGIEINLLARMATFSGLNRFIEREKEKIASTASRVLFFQSNLPDDIEQSSCAQERRRLLETSVKVAEPSFQCVRCERPISSNDVDYIEYSDETGPKVGLSHQSCTKPDDRVIGTIYSEFFKKYDFLKNFDAVRWFENIPRGQGGYAALELAAGHGVKMTWSGRSPRASTGTHVVEFELEDGTSEFSYHRGQLDRFSKQKADRYCAEMNKHILDQRERGDPLCLSQDTIQFGARSTILMMVGGTDKLRPIVRARVRRYRPSIARRYDNSDNWFAPVAYVRMLPDETPIGIGDAIFLITQPLQLDRFISNWRECGLELSDYEVPILANDEEFDHFAREQFDDNREFLIDPVFHVEGGVMRLVKGTPLLSMKQVEAAARQRDQSRP